MSPCHCMTNFVRLLIGLFFTGFSVNAAEQEHSISRLTPGVWEAQSIGGRETALLVILEFADAQRIIGSLGCNLVNAHYVLSPRGEIAISRITPSRRPCPADLLAEEKKVIQALQEARSVRGTRQTLRLIDSSGRTLIQFIPPTGPVVCH